MIIIIIISILKKLRFVLGIFIEFVPRMPAKKNNGDGDEINKQTKKEHHLLYKKFRSCSFDAVSFEQLRSITIYLEMIMNAQLALFYSHSNVTTKFSNFPALGCWTLHGLAKL